MSNGSFSPSTPKVLFSTNSPAPFILYEKFTSTLSDDENIPLIDVSVTLAPSSEPAVETVNPLAESDELGSITPPLTFNMPVPPLAINSPSASVVICL